MRSFSVFLSGIVFLPVFLMAAPMAVCEEKGTPNELEEFDFANGLYSRGMFDMAIRGYKGFLDEYPASQYAELAEYRIAESYFMSERYDEALNRLSLFLQRYPAGKLAGKAKLRKGQAYYLQGDHETAERVFIKLIGKDVPSVISLPARYYIANIYLKRGDFAKAVSMLKAVLDSDEDNEFMPFVYMTLGDVYDKKKEYISAAEAYVNASELPAGGSIRAEACFRAARSYQIAGKKNEALDLYDKALISSEGENIFDNAAAAKLALLYNEGRYDEVISSAPSLLEEVTPGNDRAQILFMLGNSLFQEDRFNESFKIFKQITEVYPDTEYGNKALLNSGWALFKTDNFDECVKNMDSYLGEDDMFRDEAMYVKGKALALNGKTDEALKIFNEIRKSGTDAVYIKEALYEIGWLLNESGSSEGAVNSFQTFTERYPDDPRSASVLLRKAQENSNMGKFAAAEADYKKFIGLYPGDKRKERAVFQLGRVYLDKGEYDRAVETYEGFIKEFPASEVSGHARFLAGRAFQKKGSWDKAIATYKGLLSSTDEELRHKSRESSAYCYFSKGDHAAAAGLYAGLMKEGYKLPDGVYRWSADYFLNSDESRRSLEVLEGLAKAYPKKDTSGELDYMYGENYGKLGEWDKAVEYYKKALKAGVLSPYRERVYVGLGKAAASAGRYEEAIELFEKALDEHEDNMTGALARFEMGNVKFKTMDFEGAAKEYMMVAILYEDEMLCSESLYRAGEAFAKTDQPERSEEAYKELIEKYPENKFAADAEEKLKKAESE